MPPASPRPWAVSRYTTSTTAGPAGTALAARAPGCCGALRRTVGFGYRTAWYVSCPPCSGGSVTWATKRNRAPGRRSSLNSTGPCRSSPARGGADPEGSVAVHRGPSFVLCVGTGLTVGTSVYGWLPITFGLGLGPAVTSIVAGTLIGLVPMAPLLLIGSRTATNNATASGAAFGVRGRPHRLRHWPDPHAAVDSHRDLGGRQRPRRRLSAAVSYSCTGGGPLALAYVVLTVLSIHSHLWLPPASTNRAVVAAGRRAGTHLLRSGEHGPRPLRRDCPAVRPAHRAAATPRVRRGTLPLSGRKGCQAVRGRPARRRWTRCRRVLSSGMAAGCCVSRRPSRGPSPSYRSAHDQGPRLVGTRGKGPLGAGAGSAPGEAKSGNSRSVCGARPNASMARTGTICQWSCRSRELPGPGTVCRSVRLRGGCPTPAAPASGSRSPVVVACQPARR